MLLDSNIAIYACKPGGEALERWTQHPEVATSVVTRIEALGFPGMEAEERQRLESFFASAVEHPVDAEVTARAVALRQQRKMGLGDAQRGRFPADRWPAPHQSFRSALMPTRIQTGIFDHEASALACDGVSGTTKDRVRSSPDRGGNNLPRLS